MAYNKYEVLAIERDTEKDPVSGNDIPRIRVVCREPSPPEVRMKITKLSSSQIASYESLVGQVAMLPCRTGQTDQGLRYLVVEDGEPFAMPPTVSKSVETPKSASSFVPPVK